MNATRFICYLRKSTDVDDKQTLSIEAQEREVRALAARKGLTLVGEPIREAKSAKHPGREQFAKLLAALASGKADGILCWHLDRLARNPLDGGQLMWSLSEGIIKAIVTPDRTYTGTGEDKLLMSLIFGMATKYSDDLSSNVKRGNRERLERGLWPTAPKLGYVRDHKTGALVEDPDRFHAVLDLWQRRLHGMSVDELVFYARRKHGLTSPEYKTKGGKPVTRSQVYRMLHDRFYAGLMTYGGETYPGTHPAVVTIEQFERVQAMFLNNPDLLTHHDEAGQRTFFTYGGLMRCGSCAARVTAENKTNRWGSHYRYYHCGRKNRRLSYCPEPSIEERALDEQCTLFLRELAMPDAISTFLLAHVEESERTQSTAQRRAVLRLEGELARAQERLKRLWDLGLDGKVDQDDFTRQRELLVLDEQRAQNLLAQARTQASLLEPLKEHLNLMNEATLIFQNGDRQQKRRVLEQVVSNLVLTDKKVQFEPKKLYQYLRDCSRGPDWFTNWSEIRTLLCSDKPLLDDDHP